MTTDSATWVPPSADEWLRVEAERVAGKRVGQPSQIEQQVPDVDQIINSTCATIATSFPQNIPMDVIYGVVQSKVPTAIRAINIQQKNAKVLWSPMEMADVFHENLVQLATNEFNASPIIGLGDSMLRATMAVEAGPTPGSTDIPSFGTSAIRGPGTSTSEGPGDYVVPTGSTPITGPPKGTKGTVARYTLSIQSHKRNRGVGPLPNVIRLNQTDGDGLAMIRSLYNVRVIDLQEIKMNFSSVFTQRNHGVPFYVRIDEFSYEFSRQCDGNLNPSQFKCAARPYLKTADIEILILVPSVVFPAPITPPGILTIRLLDEMKNPLEVEQDVFPINNANWPASWDDVNQRLNLVLGAHTIRTGDSISVYGIACTQDPYMFQDAHKFKAVVIDLTTVAIYAWRPLITGRDITTNGAYLVCWNNVIQMTFGFEYEV